MVSFQNAHVTSVAMPRARRYYQLTFFTQTPVLCRRVRLESRSGHQLVRREDGGVDKHDAQQISDNVEDQKSCTNEVDVE